MSEVECRSLLDVVCQVQQAARASSATPEVSTASKGRILVGLKCVCVRALCVRVLAEVG